MAKNDTIYLSNLQSLLDEYFSLGELRVLCFVLGIDFESISGEGKATRIWDLLLYLARRDRLPELVVQAERERPKVTWPPVPDDLALPESFEPTDKGSGGNTTVSGTQANIDIGGIGGDMQGVIAGGEVKDVTITIGGQLTTSDKQPSIVEFHQLLADIQQAIAEIVEQGDLLAQVDPSAPFTAQGAEQSIKSATEQVRPEMEAAEAESMQRSLTLALNLLASILDGAKAVAKKADEVGEAVIPIVEKLELLIQKLGVAASWTAKLWLLN